MSESERIAFLEERVEWLENRVYDMAQHPAFSVPPLANMPAAPIPPTGQKEHRWNDDGSYSPVVAGCDHTFACKCPNHYNAPMPTVTPSQQEALDAINNVRAGTYSNADCDVLGNFIPARPEGEKK